MSYETPYAELKAVDLSHPQVEASGLISWLEQPGMDRPVPLTNPPGTVVLDNGSRPARSPLIGEHTMEILRELNDG